MENKEHTNIKNATAILLLSIANVDIVSNKRVDDSRVGNKLMSNLKILKIVCKTLYK